MGARTVERSITQLHPPAPPVTVGVVICAYTEERWDDMVAAVQSVRDQQRRADELVLVVDHNRQLFRRAVGYFDQVTVLENEGPKGLSGARNTGWRHLATDVVAFLDDDARAGPTWLDCLLAGYQDPSVLGVGGAVVPRWGDGRPRWLAPEFDWVVGCSHSGMPDAREAVRNFVGANMSFRRSVIEAIGGFASELGRTGSNAAGCEETELCIRAVQRAGGSRLLYDPQALVEHSVSASRHRLSYFLRRCYGEGRSKALVRQLTGPETALASERDYLRRTIPRALARELKSLARGRPGSGGRIVAMLSGIGATGLGYALVRLERASSGTRLATRRPGSGRGQAIVRV